MKMKIPDYKPSSNHVHLSEKGRLIMKIRKNVNIEVIILKMYLSGYIVCSR